MLKRILASMALTSLLLAGILLVYWWRSNHGHTDSFTLGKGSATESQFTAVNGKIMVEVTQPGPAVWHRQIWPYEFRNVLGYFLVLPAFWVALKVRSWLPRPPGRSRIEDRG